MKTQWIVFAIVVFSLDCAGQRARAADPIYEVTAENVNLRAAANAQSEVVAQVAKGTRLALAGYPEGDWLPVTPPKQVDLWVHVELLKDGVVAASSAMVRSGPGINYRQVARLDRGVAVEVRGTAGEWSKIAPPPGSVVWINRGLVAEVPRHVDPAPVPRAPAHSDDVAPPPLPAKPAVRATPPVAPVASRTAPTPAGEPAEQEAASAPASLVQGREQGKIVECTGVLRPSGWIWRRPSAYRLVEVDRRGRTVAATFLLGMTSRLESLMGKTLVVSGRQYWVQGVRDPVVVIDQVVARN